MDRRLGKASPKRVRRDSEQEIERLYPTRYQGFTAKHFHERLVRDHQFTRGYTWTKALLQSKGLQQRSQKRGVHRPKRPRRPLGMMLHQDGARHEWLGGLDAMDLIVAMDDATSEIYSAFLLPEGGAASTFQALLAVFGAHGLPLSLYTDRGSHYFYTPEAGRRVDRTHLTQTGRALAHLGVEHIAAYSPEARGRSERLFHTLQDRLVKELALAGIATVEAANDFIRTVYIPAHNVRFAVKAEQEGSAFVAIPGVDLTEILCVQEDREVGKDNTVAFHRLRLQIPPSPLRPHFVRARVNSAASQAMSASAHAGALGRRFNSSREEANSCAWPGHQDKVDEPAGGIIHADDLAAETAARTPKDGRLVHCEHGRRCISRSAVPGQQPEPIVTHYQGRRLNSPNDLTVARDGAIWFTDPTFGILMPNQSSLANPELDHRSVYRFDPRDGSLARMADLEQPNGVFFSPDGRVLYVSDTALSLGEIPNARSGKTHEIVAFDVGENGVLSNRRLFCHTDHGYPDGFAVDQRGWVWTSAADGVHVWSAERERLGFIPVSQTVSNCCFGGSDGRRLFIAATTLLLAIDMSG